VSPLPAPKDPIKYAVYIEKLRVSHLNHKPTLQTIQKMKVAQKGDKHYAWKTDINLNKFCPVCGKQLTREQILVGVVYCCRKCYWSDLKKRPLTNEQLDHLKKMATINEGTHKSVETRDKISIALKKSPELHEHLNKLHADRIGTHISIEQKNQHSVDMLGLLIGAKNPNWNPDYPLYKECEKCGKPLTRKQIPCEQRFCSHKCASIVNHRPMTDAAKIKRAKTWELHGTPMEGKHHSFETRKKISYLQLGISEDEWQGFVSTHQYCYKWTDPILKVRKRVRAFFNDTCVICGRTKEENGGAHMSVHHVGRDKSACCEGIKSDWLFVTTCKHHHKHDPTSQQTFREIIALQYGGKCMLTLNDYNLLYPNGGETDNQWGWRNGL
jgi:endogenous inhibitor of DNA gyrase (YacG/DUF329 family)